MVDVILGTQFGDEGKGKIVDLLCNSRKYDMCVRCQGGSNAGHTIVVNDKSYDFHLIPSGILNPNCICLIGHGVVIHLPTLFKELSDLEAKGLEWRGRLLVSDRAHLVLDLHQIIDGLTEIERGASSIGTTKRGVGPAYSSKANRSGIRVHHLFDWPEFESRFRTLVNNNVKRFGEFEYDIEAELNRYKEYANRMSKMTVDGIYLLNEAVKAGAKVLVEGANALMLDLDCGTFPFVTSSNTNVGGVFTGLGIPPSFLGENIGVVKAYMTRVGHGPFPSELNDAVGEYLGEKGHEFGTTTGRKRRCGWLDLVVLRFSCMINGYSCLNLTKLDVLSGLKTIKIAVRYIDNRSGEAIPSHPADLRVLDNVSVEYETMNGWNESISHCRSISELPIEAINYIQTIERHLNIPIKYIGVGSGRSDMIIVQEDVKAKSRKSVNSFALKDDLSSHLQYYKENE